MCVFSVNSCIERRKGKKKPIGEVREVIKQKVTDVIVDIQAVEDKVNLFHLFNLYFISCSTGIAR